MITEPKLTILIIVLSFSVAINIESITVYAGNEEYEEQCDKLYDMLEEGKIKDDLDFEYD